jgi:hypothetical protein
MINPNPNAIDSSCLLQTNPRMSTDYYNQKDTHIIAKLFRALQYEFESKQ